MRIFFYCFSSFILGATIIGLLSWRFFIGTLQMSELSSIRVHSQTLKLLSENKVDELSQISCFAIKNGIEYYENELSNWFLAIENASGTPEMTQQFLLQTKKQIENKEVCGRA